MSGGGGGGGDGSDRGGMISLEDLDSFSEDQPSESRSQEEEAEVMEEDENSDQLLHYWQDIARGHQVDVAQGKQKQNNNNK